MFGFLTGNFCVKQTIINQMTKATELVALKTQNLLAVIISDIFFDRARLTKTLLVLTQKIPIVKVFVPEV
jgi:hypothetical protein